jgi:hypothetical protein
MMDGVADHLSEVRQAEQDEKCQASREFRFGTNVAIDIWIG